MQRYTIEQGSGAWAIWLSLIGLFWYVLPWLTGWRAWLGLLFAVALVVAFAITYLLHWERWPAWCGWIAITVPLALGLATIERDAWLYGAPHIRAVAGNLLPGLLLIGYQLWAWSRAPRS